MSETAADRRHAMRVYLEEQIAAGLPHLRRLASSEWRRILTASEGISEAEALLAPDGEWDMLRLVEHMHLSLQRSRERLEVLHRGEPYQGGVQTGGNLPQQHFSSFASLRSAFEQEVGALEAFLDEADPLAPTRQLAGHIAWGDMHWLQWAAYLHVHARDHAAQAEQLLRHIRSAQP